MVEKRNLEEILKNPERRYGIFKIIHGNVLNDEMIDEIDSCGFAGIVGNIDYQIGFNDNEELWKKTAGNMRKYIDRGMLAAGNRSCRFPFRYSRYNAVESGASVC